MGTELTRLSLPSPMWPVPLLLLVLSVPPANKGVHLTGRTGSRVGGGQAPQRLPGTWAGAMEWVAPIITEDLL